MNRNGQPIQYTYNGAGQITVARFSDGSQYTYSYDSQGRLTAATDATGTTSFTYNTTTGLLNRVSYPGGLFLTFGYDAGGRRTTMADQTGFTTNYAYDAVGRLSGLTDEGGNAVVSYIYNATGRLSRKNNGNGTYTTYAYDANGNVLHLINFAPGGGVNSRFDYTYNSLGLETGQTTLEGAWTYAYDANGQLTHAVFASNNPTSIPNQDLLYVYDPLGNRTRTVINGVTTVYTVNSLNQYTSVGGISYTYDDNGNLLSDGLNSYSYNSINELTDANNASGAVRYTYNVLGQRVASTTDGRTTQLLIDPAGSGNIVAAFETGSMPTFYTHGLGLVRQSAADNTYFFDFDGLGSTVGLTNNSGHYLNTYSYLPFGASLASTMVVSNAFQFIGQLGVQTMSGGNHLMRIRAFQTSTGRFTSPDPLRLGGADTNFYRYASNNPLNRIDPAGLFDTDKAVIASVGLAGFFGLLNFFNSAQDYFGTIAHNLSGPYRSPQTVGQDIMGTLPPLLGNPYNPVRVPIGNPFETPITTPTTEDTPQAPSHPVTDQPTSPVAPIDPNDLIGPSGHGLLNYVHASATLSYQINFENDSSATVPAQQVILSQSLSPDFDWSTFQILSLGFGDNNIAPPARSQHFQTTIVMTYMAA